MNTVVKVKIDASIGGEKLYVHEAQIILGVNDIPSVTLFCAPLAKRASWEPPLKTSVLSPSIGEYVGLYRELYEKAEGLSENNCSVSISAEYGGPYAAEDKVSLTDGISLEGWVLADVGMSGISANGGAPYLSITAMHPICMLTKAGSVYETAKACMKEMFRNKTKDCGNLLEIVDAVYGVAADGKYVPVAKGASGLAKEFRKCLKEARYRPSSYLKFEPDGGNGIFLGNAGGDAESAKKMMGASTKSRLAQAIGDYAIPSSDGSSSWDMLLQVCGMTMLTVTQDEELNFTKEKLKLEPLNPWKKASVTLDERICSKTDVPGGDTMRISGVMCRKMSVLSDTASLWRQKNGNPTADENTPQEVFYSPVKSPTSASGRIMKISPPQVLVEAVMADAAYGASLGMASDAFLDARATGYDAHLSAYSRAVYETVTASTRRASADLVLRFRDLGGNLILPGNTCVFKSGGTPVYYGYITGVTHRLSTDGGCGTTVGMGYVRPDEDFKVGDDVAIEAGSQNAAYK